MAKITKRTVDALAGQERERVVWDDDLKGFGVRVHPTGRKVYIVKTRYRGRVIKMTIGPHGAVTPRCGEDRGKLGRERTASTRSSASRTGTGTARPRPSGVTTSC